MKIKCAFFIAIRYLWARAQEGGRYLRGAAAGIAVSLIPIIVTLIVADGMIRGITDRYLELGTGHLQVFSLMMSTSEDEEDVKNKIKDSDRVTGVWAEQRGTGIIAGNTGKTGVSIRATEPSFWEDPASSSFLKIIEGVNKLENDRDILLGEVLAKDIGVKAGDTVRLMTVLTAEDGRMIPRTAPFTVKGIISCGYNELDALWCIINRNSGKRILLDDHSSKSYIVKIKNPYKDAQDVSLELFFNLGNGYSIYTWKELLFSQYSSYESTRQMLLFIMALIVIVAAVNVSSATGMLVLERQKDIAILKVSGSKTGGITKIFLWGSFLTGLFGSVIGISLGLLLGANINNVIRSLEKGLSFFSAFFKGSQIKILDPGFYLETIPIIIDWSMVIIIWFFAVLCSVIASLIPAHRAGRLKPMELLRKN